MKTQKRQISIKYVAAGLLGVSIAQHASAIEFDVDETEVSVYGYAKLDITHDFGDVKGGENGMGNSIDPTKIAINGQGSSSGHSNLTANESRIGFRTSTPINQDDLITNIEGDFWFGDFRLRHAYGQWSGITAGQTWSNFHTFVGTTPTLDFTGPAGRDSTLRQAQLRYSLGNIHIALEDPSGIASGNSFDGGYDADFNGKSIAGTDVDRKDSLPDLTLRYEHKKDRVSFSAAAVLREIAFDDTDAEDSTLGWGGFIASSINVGSGLTLRGQLTGGDGIGSYMKLNPAPAAYRVENELSTIKSWGGTLGLSQKIGPGNLNLAYSHVSTDWDDAKEDGVQLIQRDNQGNFVDAYDDTYQIAHLNYIWSPADNIDYGLEVSHTTRDTVDSRDGDVTRFQGSVVYKF